MASVFKFIVNWIINGTRNPDRSLFGQSARIIFFSFFAMILTSHIAMANNYALLELTTRAGVPGACSKLVQLTYHIDNGANPELIQPSNQTPPFLFGGNQVTPPLLTYKDDRIVVGTFVPQTRRYSCYAAALATIWRAAGKSASEGEFLDLAGNSCVNGGVRPATLQEIISIISQAETGTPYDYLKNNVPDINALFDQYSAELNWIKIQQPEPIINPWTLASDVWTPSFDYAEFHINPLSYWLKHFDPLDASSSSLAEDINAVDQNKILPFWSPVSWYRNDNHDIKGGVFPIADTSDLVVDLAYQHDFVLVGLDGNVGHIVIVTGLKWLPSGFITIANNDSYYYLDAKTEILSIRIRDPAHPEIGQRWIPADQIFSHAQFIFALKIT